MLCHDLGVVCSSVGSFQIFRVYRSDVLYRFGGGFHQYRPGNASGSTTCLDGVAEPRPQRRSTEIRQALSPESSISTEASAAFSFGDPDVTRDLLRVAGSTSIDFADVR